MLYPPTNSPILIFSTFDTPSPLIVYVSYGKNAIVYPAYHSPPCGGGAGGGAFPLIVYPAYHSPPYGGGAGGGAFPL